MAVAPLAATADQASAVRLHTQKSTQQGPAVTDPATSLPADSLLIGPGGAAAAGLLVGIAVIAIVSGSGDDSTTTTTTTTTTAD
ncbi:MAG: hypothetical protein AAGE03_00525 [Pseudomonadota bacterium]